MKNLYFLLLSCCCYLACTPNTVNKAETSNSDRIGMTPLSVGTTLTEEEVIPYNNLESYLNRTAGVTVHGTGANAYVGKRNAEPIFVVNGREVGSSFQVAADYVRQKKIRSVRVLRHLEAEGLYGLRSHNGVIIIKTE